MTVFVINPGAGPVRGSRKAQAEKNIASFARDLGLSGVHIARDEKSDCEGRFGFSLSRGKRTCEVTMPGLSLGRVRYLGSEGQKCLDFPRLYINGSSYWWIYAAELAVTYLSRRRP